MNILRTIIGVSLLTIAAIVVEIAVSSWPPAFPGIVAAGVAFACVFVGLITVFKPARRLPIAVVAVLAGSAAGAAWWLVDRGETTFLAALTIGGLIGLIAFIQDAWSIEPPAAAPSAGRGVDAR